METFSTLLALCEGNSQVTGKFPSQRPVMRNFDVFFDLRLNREAGDLRRHHAHYDVIVMSLWTHVLRTIDIFCKGSLVHAYFVHRFDKRLE